MRLPDWPDMNASSEDIPGRAEERDATAGLAERLSRLPAGHPSADGRRAPADGDPRERHQEEAVSHLPWPDDWVRHQGRQEPGDTSGDLDEPEPQAGQPEGREPGGGGSPARHSATVAEPPASPGPYRPWFTAGDVPQPWFGRPTPDPGG